LRGTGEEYRAKPSEEIPEDAKELSSLMLRFRDMQHGMQLEGEINREGTEATLAFPIARVMAELFDKLGWMNRVLRMVAYLTVLVGAASILASLFNTMNERRREFAILRALGASRRTLFAAILGESAAMGLLGALLGLAVQCCIVAIAAAVARRETGIVLDPWFFHASLWIVPLVVIALSALAGLWPAVHAYRTEVAQNLGPSS
ncbi:MAG TPA: ABC transporter permease, partial [Planctomycetota bacterium]|nr:ABC transporter permease [Planctomycetota bacterium]